VRVIVSCQKAAACANIRLALPPRDLARSHPGVRLGTQKADTAWRALTCTRPLGQGWVARCGALAHLPPKLVGRWSLGTCWVMTRYPVALSPVSGSGDPWQSVFV
jgi:hypothetical protein